MKLISRALLAALAVSIAAVPMAQARDNGPRHNQHDVRPVKPRTHLPQRYEKPRHHWAKGQRIADWKRRTAVRDWHRHGLKRPGRGQQWVKIDNEYLLISIATGIVAGIAAGR
ncbi:RcnB family protein [Chelativorans sp. AA-79]|uniref:RcnB family protein n=1 Tax=Chelativorans sp. AA-79 TaxID=3028735 RepID=UPI0023F8E8D5|nr:RcnB family protein [Chelativorans sp. AA-79]WEX09775.1 RcnB family protein [Chelativorans sp. AA-79]